MSRAVALLLAFGSASAELVVSLSNVSSNVAICPQGAAECQLNVHLVHWVAPTNPISTAVSTAATATYVYADGSASAGSLVYTRSEYTLHDTTTGRDELPEGSAMPKGRAAQQFVAQLTASVPRAALPASVCVAVNATDSATGEAGVRMADDGCLDVKVVEVASPQRDALGAFVNHPLMTYTCADADAAGGAAGGCLAFGHVVVSAYARDPTHALFGGGSFARRAPDGVSLDAPLSGRGVRSLFQSKPTTGEGDFDGMLGPRVQVAWQGVVADRAEAERDMCFSVWAGDAVTLETVDVTAYDVDKGYPLPDEDGVFCWTPVEITGVGAQ